MVVFDDLVNAYAAQIQTKLPGGSVIPDGGIVQSDVDSSVAELGTSLFT